MRTAHDTLHLLDSTGERASGPAAPAAGDLALIGALLAVSLFPIAGELAQSGRFGPGTVGLATALALVTGREVWVEVRAVMRRRSPS